MPIIKIGLVVYFLALSKVKSNFTSFGCSAIFYRALTRFLCKSLLWQILSNFDLGSKIEFLSYRDDRHGILKEIINISQKAKKIIFLGTLRPFACPQRTVEFERKPWFWDFSKIKEHVCWPQPGQTAKNLILYFYLEKYGPLRVFWHPRHFCGPTGTLPIIHLKIPSNQRLFQKNSSILTQKSQKITFGAETGP